MRNRTFQDVVVESSGRFPKVMEDTVLENLPFFHLCCPSLYEVDIYIQGCRRDAGDPSHSFVIEPWFLVKHILHRIRTGFYNLSGPRVATRDICRAVG